MQRNLQGHYITTSAHGEQVKAFVPSPLPPEPPIEWSSELRGQFDEAMLTLGRFDSQIQHVPDPSVFLYLYVRKEAVLSSMIEGTQSSLTDLLKFEQGRKPNSSKDDVVEVSNYVAALSHGMQRLAEGFPISLRLLREIHGVLMKTGRGSQQSPGEFRRTQNWIGGTRPGNAAFVPPPPQELMSCLDSLERFLHDQPQSTPPLLKAALAHVQFETIHPFLDGNGRVGRLLISLLLWKHNILSQPLLYLSLYLKQHRQYYYDCLNAIRLNGDWEQWLAFFADAVISTASQASDTVQALAKLKAEDREQIDSLGRARLTPGKIHDVLLKHPIVTAAWLAEQLDITPLTINNGLEKLIELGVVEEVTGQKRHRLYRYSDYIDILEEGMELP